MTDGGSTIPCMCGGLMFLRNEMKEAYLKRWNSTKQPRHSKNRRIAKKHHKAWLEKNQTLLRDGMVIGATGPGRFECAECGQTEGFYQALGRTLVTVEEMQDV